jgi:hypothetical protein
MPFWKSLLLVAIVTAAYFFARPYFPYIALAAGVAWLAQYFRPKPIKESSDLFVAGRLADLLGLPRHPFQKAWKFRRDNVTLHLAVSGEPTPDGEVVLIDVASPLFVDTPFCFVIRSRSARIKEAGLVENSRIPGVQFEYQLSRLPSPDGLEGASNMPDLFREVSAGDAAFSPLALFGAPGLDVEKVFFNGRVLHTLFVLGPSADRYRCQQLLHVHTGFHLTLKDILANVSFKVPV